MHAPLAFLCFALLALSRPAGGETARCGTSPDLACLGGRAGGQRLQGGTGNTDALSLAGPGHVRVESPASFSTVMPDADATFLAMSPSRALRARAVTGIDMSPAFRWTVPGALFGFRFGGTHEVATDPTALNFMSALYVNYTSRSSTAGVAPWFPDMIIEQWTAQMDGPGNSATTGLIPIAFVATPSIKASGGARLNVLDRCALSCNLGTNRPCRTETEGRDCAGCATGTAGSCSDRGGLVTIYAHPTLRADDASALHVVRRAVVLDRGVRLDADGSGAVTLGTENTIYIADRSGAEQTRAIESQLRDGPGKFFLHASGDAPSVHAGRLRVGNGSPPQRTLDVAGDAGVTGGLRVGDGVVATAALDLAPGRDQHLRMAGAAEDPEAPAPGDLWYSTSGGAHRVRTPVGSLALGGVLATITEDSAPVAGTTAETPFSNGAVPLPPDSFTTGKTIRVRAGGRYTSRATAPRLTVRWSDAAASGGNLVVDTGSPAMPSAVADGGWTLDADITVRAAGRSGRVAARGVASFGGTPGSAVVATDRKRGAADLDTTVPAALTLLASVHAPAAGDTVTLEMLTVEVLN